MKKLYLFIATLSLFSLSFLPLVKSAYLKSAINGLIFLQVEQHGEAWYVYPPNSERYYLGRPTDAFNIMRSLALGVPHSLIADTVVFPERFAGLILLDIEQHGEAYYIYPKNLNKYYLGKPDDAFRVMRELGQGITDSSLNKISEGQLKNVTSNKPININVPFTSQAPFAAWSDLRQEDGCEEASSLMAVRWAQGKPLNKDEALKAIIGSSDYTLKKYGEYRDVSAFDTVDWIIKDYFNYPNVILKNNISLNDLINELKRGNVIIAPMNGQKLNNPNFVAPGPEHHMLVIRGYDPLRQVFITNDPGTRRGEGYEYSAKTIYDSIRDYPTGNHEPVIRVEKNIIVVWK